MPQKPSQFEIQDYDDGDLEEGITPGRPASKPVLEPVAQTSQPEPIQRPVQEYAPQEPPRRPSKARIAAQLFWIYRSRTIPFTIVMLVLIVLAVPVTRYPVVGIFLRRHYDITLLDSSTGRPVAAADVSLGDKQAITDKDGRARLSVRVGKRMLKIDKKYYQTGEVPVFVGINVQRQPQKVSLQATGRQVPVTVSDRISGKPIANATVKALDTSAITDAKGKAFVVLPASDRTQKAVITANGYNQTGFDLRVTDQTDDANSQRIVPSGRTVFLSNASGNIDVIGTNFDGTGRKTLIAGTGSEDDATRLYVSPDLKYAVLHARRDASNQPKFYIIDVGSGSIKLLDNALADYVPVGWAGGRFIYVDTRQDLQSWQPGNSELKSYGPTDSSVTVLDKSAAEGSGEADYVTESITTLSTEIIDGSVLYAKSWSAGYQSAGLANRTNVVYKVQPDGKGRQTLRSIPVAASAYYTYMTTTRVKPQTIYFTSQIGATNVYYSYQNGVMNQSNVITSNDVSKAYPDYMVSPDGKSTYWSEVRDGKSVFFIGDANAGNARQVARLDGYTAYSWNGEDRLLLTKDSQLFVMSKDGPSESGGPLKIADFFTPKPTR